MKKAITGVLVLLIGIYMAGCRSVSNNQDNPLNGKNTDERIIMCLEKTYPEQKFNVMSPFDEKKGTGTYTDEAGIEFEVHDILYNNKYHFGCRDEYLSTLLKKQNYQEKAENIVKKYKQSLSFDEEYTVVDITLDENSETVLADAAKMILEILNSVDIPEVEYPMNQEFSTGEVNYFTQPTWGILQCHCKKEEVKMIGRFYFSDKNKSVAEIESVLVDLNQSLKEEIENNQ